MASSEFSAPLATFLQSLVGKQVKLEMMNGGGGEKDVSSRMRGVVVGVYADGILLDRDDKTRILVFAQAIRAVNEEPARERLPGQAVSIPGKAHPGGKLF